jgi:zinc transport system substrate-binding protein
MTARTIFGWPLLACVVTAAAACGTQKADHSTARGPTGGMPDIAAVNYPLAFFAERIGGDSVRVDFPVPADADPDHWLPATGELARIQQADLILLNGSGYAAWTQRASLPWSRCRDTSADFKDRYLKLEEAVTHKHGPQGEHAHDGLATHTWLDPQLARQQAHSVSEGLLRLLPEQEPAITERWSALDGQLGRLERELHGLASSRPLFASHPVYDYLARFCGWQLKSMHWEPHDIPDEAQWKHFAELHQAHPASIMLWEAPPADATRERLEHEFGVRCVPFATCSQRPTSGDYISVMSENITALKQALEETDAAP